MLAKAMRLRCTGYGEKPTIADGAKGAAWILGSAVVTVIVMFWLPREPGGHPYRVAFLPNGWLFGFVSSMRFALGVGGSNNQEQLSIAVDLRVNSNRHDDSTARSWIRAANISVAGNGAYRNLSYGKFRPQPIAYRFGFEPPQPKRLDKGPVHTSWPLFAFSEIVRVLSALSGPLSRNSISIQRDETD
jgi:hypothetical protein